MTSPSWTMSIEPSRITQSPNAGGAVLDKRRLARVESVLRGPLERRPDLLRIDPVEGRVARQECVKVLHVGGRNCVRIASVTRYGDMRA